MNLSLDNISFSYDNEIIINAACATFESGHFYSILGPNGSGKTTLLDLISGFLIPDTGHIEINQTLISSLSKREISKKISLVSQDHAINFPFSVKEVILMGRHPYIPRLSHPSQNDLQQVEKVMDICRIRHLKDRKINELSGGERQRCVFARAMCQDTPIFLLDEAFSNMDINHTLQLLKLVKRSVMEQNKIVISVFHDLNLASSWSDAILMLKNGEIKAFGTSREVLTQQIIKDVFDVTAVVEFNKHVQARQVYYPSI